jgi:hypothetical protein
VKNADAWIEELEEKIEQLKGRDRKSHMLVNEKMSQETANHIESHFKAKGYTVEKRKCSSCGGWDIIFTDFNK